MRVLAAPDKFRGSLTALEVADAINKAVNRSGGIPTGAPMADGGEGTLEVLGGPNRTTIVAGPSGGPVKAEWRLAGKTAVIEVARVSGLTLAGGPENNNPLEATTKGTGELIRCALEQGAKRIIVGLGGSASTDGGLGALKAMGSLARYKGIELIAACDVRTDFLSSADSFAAQKGATPTQVKFLNRRLQRLVQVYEEDYKVSVEEVPGGGAAGGLAGGLLVAGAKLVDGFDFIAQEIGLDEMILESDIVITGEGHLDKTSFEGKVVSGVCRYADAASVPVFVIAGAISAEVAEKVDCVSLIETFGEERAFSETELCIEKLVTERIELLSR